MRIVIWILLLLVFTVRCYDVFVDHYAFTKLSDVEKTGEETKSTDPDEDIVKKSGKDMFSFFDDGLLAGSEAGSVCMSEHWRIYSLVIFKEPLRDVLTPPPNPAI